MGVFGCLCLSTLMILYSQDLMLLAFNLSFPNCKVSFLLRILDLLDFFLGIQATRTTASLHLCQAKYISYLLHRTQMIGAKPSKSPCSSSIKLSKFDGITLSDPFEYRHVVGSLQYCALTRPEIAFAVN
jgi:hypothetical protein